MDMVFDSVNGSSVKSKHGKPLRAAVTDKSPHLPFWTSAIKVFESMYFLNRVTGQKSIYLVLIIGLKHCAALFTYGITN